jgi:hypothetical protein
MSKRNLPELRIFIDSPDDFKKLKTSRQSNANFEHFLKRRSYCLNDENCSQTEGKEILPFDVFDSSKTSKNKLTKQKTINYFNHLIKKDSTKRKSLHKKSTFAIFENKESLLSKNTLSSANNFRLSAPISYKKCNTTMNNKVEYFSIQVNENLDINETFNNIKITKEDKLPEIVESDIKNDFYTLINQINNLENKNVEINNRLLQNQIKLNKLKEMEQDMLHDLKELKNARNKLISEKVVMTNELEYIKVNFILFLVSA